MRNRITIASVLTILLILTPFILHSNKNTSLSLLTNQSSPEMNKDEWFAMDKFLHVIASAGITGVSYHYYHCQYSNPHKNSLYFSLSVAGMAGIGKEFIDKKYRKTGWSWKDITADAVGIAVGYLLFIHLGKNQ